MNFRVRSLTPGRPKPGSIAIVEVKTYTRTGEFRGWQIINYFCSNAPTGGRSEATRFCDLLNKAWDEFHRGRVL